ncbi:MAG: hypothetical protein HQK70_10990, partial [Desulfamplus sp.]|nr:hypothetical protein [Desulfamplus sp.]
MKQKTNYFIVSLSLILSVVVFGLPSASWGSCETEEFIIQNKYIGTCGYTQSSSFTLEKDTYITHISIWYDTNVGGNSLSVNLTGTNGYISKTASTTKGVSQWSWCEGIWNLNDTLKAGTYTLTADSKSICANPSGLTTLTIYGCDAEEQLPDDTTEGIDPPEEVSVVDLTSNPSTAPVYMGNIVSSGGNVGTLSGKMELSVDFPAYNKPVDIWILVGLPDGRFYVADEFSDLMNLDEIGFLPIASGAAGSNTVKTILQPFDTADSDTPFDPMSYGVWTVYWLVAPESNGDIFQAIDNGNYELGFYMFEISNSSSNNQVTQNIGTSGGSISLPGLNLTIPKSTFSSSKKISIEKSAISSGNDELSDTYTIKGLPYSIGKEMVLDIESKSALNPASSDMYYIWFEFEVNNVVGINYITYSNHVLKANIVGNNTLRVTIPVIDFQAIIEQENRKSYRKNINDDGLTLRVKAVELIPLSTEHFVASVKQSDQAFANKTLQYLEESYEKLGTSVGNGGFGFNWLLNNCRINTNTFQYEKIPVVFFKDSRGNAFLGSYNAGLSGELGFGGPCNTKAFSAVLEFNTDPAAMTNGDKQLKAVAAHELFHFLQAIYNS